jgi:hypothetical protein
MNFWEVFGFGVFIGIFVGIWIAYAIVKLGEWGHANEKNNSLHNFYSI